MNHSLRSGSWRALYPNRSEWYGAAPTSMSYNQPMTESAKANVIVEAVVAAFSESDSRPTPEQVETLMCPFAPISYGTEREIDALLHQRGRSSIDYRINSWMEANDVVSGEGGHVERRIQFLLRDTCTCVLDHLPKAVEHATKPVDPRVLKLLEHKYLQK